MTKIENWMGFAVPVRDNNNVRHRRITQGDHAMGILDRILDKKEVAVQAGANWGYWPLRLSCMFDVVYTFEPDPTCFTCLCANTSNRDNVIRIQAALGYCRDLVDLHRDVDTTGNQHVSGPGVFPTLRIDDLGLKSCDLIYLDVEGQEDKALLGAEMTIKKCKPVVIYEERQKAFAESAKASREFLEGLGYHHKAAIGADIVMAP